MVQGAWPIIRNCLDYSDQRLAESACSFTIHMSAQYISSPGTSPTIPVPAVVPYLVVACRRKLSLYSWKDREPQEVQVRPLMPMLLSLRLFSTTLTENDVLRERQQYCLFILAHGIRDILPQDHEPRGDHRLPAMATTMGIGAFSGLTGYMTLSPGSKAKPSLLTIKESEILVAKDSTSGRDRNNHIAHAFEDVGHFSNPDGSPSRSERID